MFTSLPNLRLLSNFFINVSAAYFMLAAVTIGFISNNPLINIIIYLSHAILYFALAVKIEEKIKYE
ncbi:hypothetical protein A2767_07205 [Candidatus Roizmanbacteria bacterium RIFCSPHIGHO2_01_FULL_35_10]|uniref:Uncharacterized protein n=1 Tax=Candidatus Roizmanbacteria bacterium RIFCSPLOWO2_01_FULL_35_13 TaxID=1802055 RepID=A0A1F7I823_9BACT|nr:MAG: hypothetical protein A2767_07205 [Candidatus Roizmanbacteria bacterium RIFCSPHIGHO2_01_FULL_35_10]OGK39504.1 MAG: hypothetical protein A3A74_00595 [Candidatus Roizmanbacteria bacterium RIFCSPLOWO2_01_FULL_35_13]